MNTMKKLSFKQILSISVMLFAMFFGAGNMIFPASMGQLAGTNYFSALMGFILTDAGIAILGIAAVVFVGNSMNDLASLVSKKFAVFFGILVYLLIGPLFALPRTGSVSFEIMIYPYLDGNVFLPSIIFTLIFFGITYYLSSNPSKIVDIISNYLTPILLLSIFTIFIASLIKEPVSETLDFGTMVSPSGEYVEIPFFTGMVEGYNALDGPAGLAFAIIVINAIKNFGIKEKGSIIRYTLSCGIIAAIFLSIVYFMLTYVGALTGTPFDNGGALLHAVTNYLFGNLGAVILGVAVLLACLTTSIGLTTAFADYFHSLFPKYSYKKIAAYVCIFSFIVANVGLSTLISISLPILIMIYPVTVVLILLSFMKKYIKHRRMVYILSMIFAFVVSFFNGLENADIQLGFINQLCHMLPFYEFNLGWVLPAIKGAILGYMPFWPINKKEENKLMNVQ